MTSSRRRTAFQLSGSHQSSSPSSTSAALDSASVVDTDNQHHHHPLVTQGSLLDPSATQSCSSLSLSLSLHDESKRRSGGGGLFSQGLSPKTNFFVWSIVAAAVLFVLAYTCEPQRIQHKFRKRQGTKRLVNAVAAKLLDDEQLHNNKNYQHQNAHHDATRSSSSMMIGINAKMSSRYSPYSPPAGQNGTTVAEEPQQHEDEPTMVRNVTRAANDPGTTVNVTTEIEENLVVDPPIVTNTTRSIGMQFNAQNASRVPSRSQ